VNYTGSSIDLSAYTLKKQTNGSGSWSTSPLSLSGTLVNGEVYVIANSSADAAILSQADSTPSSAVLSFNGNDPIGLFKDDVLIDIVGVFDGGSGNNFGENRTLQRKFSVTSPADPFNTNEWITFATDTFTRLGAHTVTGTNTFLELTDTNWDDTSNWSFNSIPSSGDNIIVRANKTINTTENITLGNLTVETNAAFNISSGGSLIVTGTATGTITYKRELTANDWYLVSPPVAGQNYNDTWASANNVYLSNGTYGIAVYDYVDAAWVYAPENSSGAFTNGKGYGLKLHTTGDVTVTGTFNSADSATQIYPDRNGYNLVGNPYPSFLNTSTMMDAQNGLAAQTIWIWRGGRDGGSSTYETYPSNLAPNIAPGQGFFVKCSSTSNFNILESYQTHEDDDTFERPLVNPEIYLKLTDDSKTSIAKIYYIEGTTTSFDNGYDGEMFGASSNAFAIYTHLVGNEQGQVGNSQGHGYAVQSLPADNYENMVVPVGINATRGTTITIEATLNNFPEGINVYLADKQENSVTLLETDTSYSTTLEEDLNGVGRFYIHTTPNALSSGEVLDSIPLSIYSLDSETLHIEGVATGTAYLQLYTMLGKELMQTSFEGTGVNEILLPNHLNAGIYIVKIATTTGVTSKKIMIN
ncbi:MAG: T9SS type A sorting domain-containing protein, partial [Hellea sp.]|nr:T9SS type A sorting domain-containing protein [Hellea sp.]